MNNPLFSIIVPVYNVEPYIATCIESILWVQWKSTGDIFFVS